MNAVSRFVVLVLISAIAAQFTILAQESTQTPPTPTSDTAPSLTGSADASAAREDEGSPEESVTAKPPTNLIGGAVIDLFQKAPAPASPTTEGDAPASPVKLTGWQLFNVKAPITTPSKPEDWTGRRPLDKRLQRPKETDTNGIKLFFITF